MRLISTQTTRAMRLLFVTLLTLLTVALWAAPRNVILMIGDGMGPDIVTAAGAYQYGTDYHAFGGEKKLVMETLTTHYFATTYSTSSKGYDFTWNGGNAEYPKASPTDSAAAATALATGVKTYNGAISVDAQKRPLVTITEFAQQAGLRTGVITTVPFYDATPAAFASHNTGRGNAQDIAYEMVMETAPDVLMGGGHPGMNSDAAVKSGKPSWKVWDAISAKNAPFQLVQDRAEFQALIEKPATGKLLGFFRSTGNLTPRKADGKSADPTLPTLAEMTQVSLNALDNPRGFFLMVEGGAIDKNAHPNKLDETIGETLAFDEAIAATLAWIGAHGGWEENLLIVTADHDTGYLNSVKPTAAGTLPTVTWGTTGSWGSHTNRMVPVFTQGAGSENFAHYALRVQDFQHGLTNVVDNTAIFQVMKTALPLQEPAADVMATPAPEKSAAQIRIQFNDLDTDAKTQIATYTGVTVTIPYPDGSQKTISADKAVSAKIDGKGHVFTFIGHVTQNNRGVIEHLPDGTMYNSAADKISVPVK